MTLSRVVKPILPFPVYKILVNAANKFNKAKYDIYLHKKIHQKTDIFVVSFPKSGRTWARSMLGKYLELKYGIPFTTELHELNKNELPNIAFSHDLKDIQYHKNKKVILLVRDPRDTMVSYYHHCVHRDKNFEGPISKFVRNKRFGIQPIIKYLNTMIKYRHYPSEVLWIKYEDLHQNPKNELIKMLKFLNLKVDEKDINQTIRFSDFKNMQKMEKEGKFDSERLRSTDIKNPHSLKVRKGKIGSYKEELKPSDIDYINLQIEKNLRLKDYT